MLADTLSVLAHAHVWGIGLTRTGTSTLNRALTLLGYRSVHWPTTAQLLYGNLEAATDESVAALYKYLDSRYPGSLFVLTDRDEHSWLRSVAKHRAHAKSRMQTLLAHSNRSNVAFRNDRAVEIRFTQTALYGSVEFDEDRFRKARHRHLSDVCAYFSSRPDCLLRLNICEGDAWPQLCSFLHTEVPIEPFPHENQSAP